MEENKTKKDEYLKLGFFKKMWYSMTKFEKYPEMAALGVKKAIIYFTELMLVFSIIFSAIYVYYISNIAENDGEDISLSQKIVNQLIDTNDETLNQELADTIEVLEEYPASIMVATVFLSVFISVYISTLIDVFTLSIFGLITCFFAKIKMNYKAIFNMSIFALTLSIILRIIYSAVTMLFGFEVKYFEVMYVAVSYIILAAAIFMIKSDVIKQHLELMKIIDESKNKIEKTITIPERPKDKEEKKKDDKKDDKEEEDKENDTEGQSSNA